MSPPAYLREPPPPYGTNLPVGPGIARIVAPNPGHLTYHGTNSWLVETAQGRVVIDPGPADESHLRALLAAAGPIAAILLTHSHHDHIGAAPALARASGAKLAGFAPAQLAGFTPDIALSDGATLCGLRALHTPGHAPDHLCFATADGVLFSGDHVMGWSSSTVAAPDGDMGAYLASLERLLGRSDHLYLPGHGPPVPDPASHVRALHGHRLAREAAILDALARRPHGTADLRALLYPDLPAALHPAATATLAAHLARLAATGRARQNGDDGSWALAHPAR